MATLSLSAIQCRPLAAARRRAPTAVANVLRVSGPAEPFEAAAAPYALSTDEEDTSSPAPSLAQLAEPRHLLVLNGRLAMAGVIAGLGTELLTHEPLAVQIASSARALLAVAAIIAAATAAPLLRGEDEGDEGFGPLTAAAELLNGKVALAALVAAMALETAKGSSIF